MPFSIRPYRRFSVCWPVTYQFGAFDGHGSVWNGSRTGWRFSGYARAGTHGPRQAHTVGTGQARKGWPLANQKTKAIRDSFRHLHLIRREMDSLLLCILIRFRKMLIPSAVISASCLLGQYSPLWAEPSGNLLIKCDAPISCAVSLDGNVIGAIGPGKMKGFSVPVGDHLLVARSSDRRFASMEYGTTISVYPHQTVEEVTLYVPIKAAVEAALKGTVTVRTNTEANLLSIDRKWLRWDALTNHEEWNKSGFVRTWTEDYVAAKPGVEIEAIGVAFAPGGLGTTCYVRGQFLGVEFLVGYAHLAFVDKKNHVDLTSLIMCNDH